MNRDSEGIELFSAYRDGDLEGEQRKAFEEQLEGDDELRREYETFGKALDSLSLLRDTAAPDHFTEKLQGRIRRRSGGKLFGPGSSLLTRVPYELFSLVLILIILTAYLVLMPVDIAAPGSGSDGSSRPESPESSE